MARLRGANHPPPASAGPKPLAPFHQATVCWLDAQYLATLIEEARARRGRLQERIRNGERWLATRGPEHPQWERARGLLPRLEAQYELAGFNLAWLRYAAWDQVCCAYQAYQHCSDAERRRWHREHHPTDVSSPQALWAWLNTGMGPLDWPREGPGFGWYADGRVYHGFDWR